MKQFFIRFALIIFACVFLWSTPSVQLSVVANDDVRVRIPDGLDFWETEQWIEDFVQSFFTQPFRLVSEVRRGNNREYLYEFHVILEDGSMWGWGDNRGGRLGDGTTQNQHVPVMILDSVVIGGRNSALRYDGTFWTWGYNRLGDVGDGTTENRLSPVMVMNHVVSAPYCGCGVVSTKVLRADGTLWTWGRNNGRIGDGTTENRLTPVLILDNVTMISDSHGGMAVRGDGSTWAWGRHQRNDPDGTYVIFHDSLAPEMVANGFIEHEFHPNVNVQQLHIRTFPLVEGAEWPDVFRVAQSIGEVDTSLALPPPPVFNHDPDPEYPAEYIYTTLQNINLPGLAIITDPPQVQLEIMHITVESLTPETLNIATLYIENVNRRGTSQPMPLDGQLSTELLMRGVDTANQIRQNTFNTLIVENFTLMRRLRTNINFISEETQGLYIAFPDNISAIPFDNVTMESEFAAVTINHSHIRQGGEIIIRRVPMPAQAQTTSNLTGGINTIIHPPMAIAAIGAMAATPSESILSRLANFWSIPIIALIIVGWLVLTSRGVKIKTWIAPTLTVVLACANVGTFILGGSDDTIATHNELEPNMSYAIEVTMTEGMRATISLPANGDNPEFLIMFNEHGELQYSKYNPVTGNIDANIRENGIYFLREQAIDFADIDAMHQRMQDSIRRLAARDIMRGTDDGYFHPNDLITRAEFIAAIVMAFDMLDFNAQTSFADLSPSDWFYHAIATAENEGLLIAGFDDNTFRGMSEMPKDQLIVVAANTLMERMGYFVPLDIERYLMLFLDRPILEEWSEDGIALATSSNVVMFRTDSLFAPQSIKTRGDAAIVLYNVFSRVW